MRKNYASQSGFTLIELMIVVAIIGVLTLVALPAYQDYVVRARLTEMVVQLDSLADRIKEYEQITGNYPDDTHIDPPDEVPMPDYWYNETLLGGNYNWEGPDGYPYAGISILGATAPERHIQIFDRIIDNGDLATGAFRQTPNGRYTFIINE